MINIYSQVLKANIKNNSQYLEIRITKVHLVDPK